MISSLLSKIGLPILIKFVGASLSGLNNETAQKAGIALSELNTVISKQEISSKEMQEANRHIEKLQQFEKELDSQTLSEIHETIRKELSSEDRFVRFWRPAFGYSVALAWLLTMSTICFVIIADYPNAEGIVMSLVETTSLWSVALGVLGIQVVKRSQEKQNRRNDDILSKTVNKLM